MHLIRFIWEVWGPTGSYGVGFGGFIFVVIMACFFVAMVLFPDSEQITADAESLSYIKFY